MATLGQMQASSGAQLVSTCLCPLQSPSVRSTGVSESSTSGGRFRLTGLLAVMGLVLLAAACGSSSKSSSSSTAPSTTSPPSTAPAAAPTTAAAKGSGPVDVLYAGSLVDVMEKQIGPGFDAATGYTFDGFSGDSGTLATEIKGKVRQGDVYISASPAQNAKLMGPTNGDWVSWYALWATSPLVLGYNPHSKFAADLRTKPWYEVLVEPGILIGRTDPATDPKGKLTVEALESAAATHNEPGLKAITTDPNTVFPENTLVGRLQSGQLDVGFFYAAEASAAKIPTVPLQGEDYSAMYTVTVLNRAPHQAGGEAFVSYLLGPAAKPALSADGFILVTPPKVTGTGVPASLQSAMGM